MKPVGLFLFAAIVALFFGTTSPYSASAAERRTWSDATGKFNVEAEFVRLDGDNAVIKAADGREISVPISKLSAGDQKYLADLKAKMEKPEPEPKRDATGTIIEPTGPGTDPTGSPIGPTGPPPEGIGPPPDLSGSILIPPIEEHIRGNGFAPLTLKPETPTRNAHRKKLRDWMARTWEYSLPGKSKTYRNLAFCPRSSPFLPTRKFSNLACIFVGWGSSASDKPIANISSGNGYGGHRNSKKTLDALDINSIKVEMRVEGSLLTFIIDGKTVFDQVDAAKFGFKLWENGKMQFGVGHTSAANTHILKNVQIRSLPSAIGPPADF